MNIFFKPLTNPLSIKHRINSTFTIIQNQINSAYIFANLHDPEHRFYEPHSKLQPSDQCVSVLDASGNLSALPELPTATLSPSYFEIYHPVDRLSELKKIIPTAKKSITHVFLHQNILDQPVITHIVRVKKGEIYQKYLSSINQTVLVVVAEVIAYYPAPYHSYEIKDLYAQFLISLENLEQYDFQLNYFVSSQYGRRERNIFDHYPKRSIKTYLSEKYKTRYVDFDEKKENPYVLDPQSVPNACRLEEDPFFDSFLNKRLIEHPLLLFSVYSFLPMLRMMKLENIHQLSAEEIDLWVKLKRVAEILRRNPKYTAMKSIRF